MQYHLPTSSPISAIYVLQLCTVSYTNIQQLIALVISYLAVNTVAIKHSCWISKFWGVLRSHGIAFADCAFPASVNYPAIHLNKARTSVHWSLPKVIVIQYLSSVNNSSSLFELNLPIRNYPQPQFHLLFFIDVLPPTPWEPASKSCLIQKASLAAKDSTRLLYFCAPVAVLIPHNSSVSPLSVGYPLPSVSPGR